MNMKQGSSYCINVNRYGKWHECEKKWHKFFYHTMKQIINEKILKIISNQIHVQNLMKQNILRKNECFSHNQQILSIISKFSDPVYT